MQPLSTALAILFLALSIHPSAWAEAQVQGVVLLNQSGGAPIPGATLSAEGATQTVSDATGRFTLRFPHLQPGHEVRINVVLANYVVVNKIQLDRPLPDNDAKPLEVILCKTAQWEKWAGRFFRFHSK